MSSEFNSPPSDTPSLQLPYERLKTADTAYRAARVPAAEPITAGRLEATSRDDRVALIIASAVALFYRYSGQNVIPVSLRVYSPDGVRSQALAIPVNGATRPQELLGAVANELERPAGPAALDAPFLLEIRFHERHERVAPDEIASCDIRADVCLQIDFVDESIDESIETSMLYNESLLSQPGASRLLSHFRTTLLNLQRDPLTNIAGIALLSQEEHAWFTAHCHAAPLQFAGRFIHEEIAEHASITPHRTAVRFNEEQMSYAELNSRANQLARYLRSRGIPSEGRILVCLDPSLEVAVTLLAILKAGATYVPINPAHPEFRIRAIVEDTAPDLIVTNSCLKEFVAGFGIDILDVGDPPPGIARESADNLLVEVRPEQIAYVYYTSGTTGYPKGVAASHANMMHFINVSRHRYRISSNDVIPAVASFAFSISLFELTSALSVGGTLLILERQHVVDAERMAATLQAVTLFHIGPALLKSIVKFIKREVPDYAVYANVRHASSGGDMVPAELLCDLQQIFTRSELYVIYGCSEISLMGCTWELPPEPVTRSYVGQPFANVHLLVLDDDGNQVPIGAIGDVCFGGAGVVNGYLNNPERTEALFFVRDGIRYYRTGDRGRLNAKGELELLGRRDFQIQIRGMRIELAEIDYHLRQAADVRDGLVAARPHRRGETVLVAFYVPEGGRTIPPGELHAHMSARLPDYMVPVFYVALDALPLNYNLKIDRRALPELTVAGSSGRNPPVSKTEVALERIWCDLLHVDDVSLDDNFMLLGGDSLLAMEMIFLVKRELGVRLDGMDVLRESLLVLARIIDREKGASAEAQRPGEPVVRDVLPVSSFYFGPDMSLYGLYSEGVGRRDGRRDGQRDGERIGDTRAFPVLLCPPIGYEYARCQFLLRTLAERLAEAGVPSLRFDFFGMADSLGNGLDASFERWREDLLAALTKLKRRTGSDRVRVFCLRLTSILALQALPSGEIDRWVLWDPVVDGAAYYRELRKMTEEKVRTLLVIRNLKRPRKIPGGEELVGTTFSSRAIETMKALSLQRADLPSGAGVRRIVSADYCDGRDAPAGAATRGILDDFPEIAVRFDSQWYRSTRVTMAITNKEVLHMIDEHLRAADQ